MHAHTHNRAQTHTKSYEAGLKCKMSWAIRANEYICVRFNTISFPPLGANGVQLQCSKFKIIYLALYAPQHTHIHHRCSFRDSSAQHIYMILTSRKTKYTNSTNICIIYLSPSQYPELVSAMYII